MAEKVNLGWLKDYKDIKFAPKTTASQILNNDGTSYAKSVQDQIDKKPGRIVAGETFLIDNEKSVYYNESYTAEDGAEIFNDLDSCKAIGSSAHAEGYKTIATGYQSHSEGNQTLAEGIASHAEGFHTVVTENGGFAHAEGAYSTASGSASHAEGHSTTASGNYSHAEGLSTTAASEGAHAEGQNTTAEGIASHSEGDNTHAYGKGAHAEGENTHAYGVASHAEGYNNTISEEGLYAHTEGTSTKAENTSAHAEGTSTTASGHSSHAEGYETTASGYSSHTEGSYTNASGNQSHAEGSHTIASGNQSHAEGHSTTASGLYSHAEGQFTIASGDRSHCGGEKNYAIGKNSFSHGFKTMACGAESVSFGEYNIASGNGSLTGGQNSHATNIKAFAYGQGIIAKGAYSHAEGFGLEALETEKYQINVEGEQNAIEYSILSLNSADPEYWLGKQVTMDGINFAEVTRMTQASLFTSVSLNPDFVASWNNVYLLDEYKYGAFGDTSHAEGSQTIASGRVSHAEGASTTASGNYSHAEGFETEASGYYAHAEGKNTTASGDGSHAEGKEVRASEEESHAGGFRSVAQGKDSFAHGVYNIASSSNSTAFGSYNISGGINSYVNGSSSIVSGDYSSASGFGLNAKGDFSYAEGEGLNIGEADKCQILISGDIAATTYTINSISSDPEEWLNKIVTYDGIRFATVTEITDTTLTVDSTLSPFDEIINGIVHLYSYYIYGSFGQASHSEGSQTIAHGDHSHAEGRGTLTLGEASHSEGENVIAGGYASHAGNWGTIAAGNCQTVVGMNNIIDYNHGFIIVGLNVAHGYDENVVKNSIWTDQNGLSWILNSIYNDTSIKFTKGIGNNIFLPDNPDVYNPTSLTCVDLNLALTDFTIVATSNETPLGDYAFIVGNGGGDAEDRSNAMVVGWDGRTRITNDLIINLDALEDGTLTIENEDSVGAGVLFSSKDAVTNDGNKRLGILQTLVYPEGEKPDTGGVDTLNSPRIRTHMAAYKPSANNSCYASIYVDMDNEGNAIAGVTSVNDQILDDNGNLIPSRTDDIIFMGAAWNDYAEFRSQKEVVEPGYCVASANNGRVYKTTEKFQACDGIVSDTYGFAIGKTDIAKTPLAVCGRVLAYYEGNKSDYNAGDTVCAGPNGKVCKMTREEIREWPDRIVGIVSEIPKYEIWNNKVKVNDRIWIKVK